MPAETRVAGRLESLYGLMAEFGTPEALLAAAEAAREAGFERMDAYAPMPVEGLAEAVGFRKTTVQKIVLAAGFLGACGGFTLCWWMTVVAYPHNVAGRPLNSWPAYVPITFESMVLVACLTALVSMLALNGLPEPYHPVFNVPEFARASRDRFFLCIESSDARFDVDGTREFLEGLRPMGVMEVER
jgi:ActD protein